MAKATHDGTCQICGAIQRLPNGRLAKHGYTTRWGFFSGTCNGSGELPFEQSVGLILDAADRADRRAADLRAEADALRADTTGTWTWVKVFVPATWSNRQSRHDWRRVDVREVRTTTSFGEYSRFEYDVEVTKVSGGNFIGTEIETREVKDYRLKTLADAVAAGRTARAAVLDAEAAKFAEYATWQRERIAGWAPSALRPRRAA